VRLPGDVIGSVHELDYATRPDAPLMTPHSVPTDDSVLSLAFAEWLTEGGDLAAGYRRRCARYPGESCGGRFAMWLAEKG